LQAAKRAAIEPIDGGPHCSNYWRAECLDRGPQFVARILRMDNDQPIEINSPCCGGGRVKGLPAIDDDEDAAVLAGFARA
jgi:hypothetical protein